MPRELLFDENVYGLRSDWMKFRFRMCFCRELKRLLF